MSFRNREKSRHTSGMMKEDLDLKDINEPEEIGLDQKMDWLLSKQKYHFKREISYKRQHILNLITEQQSSTTKPTQPIQQQSSISNNTSSLQDAIPKILLDQGDTKNEHQYTQSKFSNLNKESLSPSVPNRFTSKKRSQFSYYSNDSYNSNLELHLGQKQDSNNQLSETRKERSKIVSNTMNQYNQQYILRQSRNKIINQIKRNNPQSSLLQLELSDKSQSQSSITTPKSILKNPSSLNSSRQSFCSLQLGSQLNTHSPSKKRKVKFCLTKQQARRENIPC
ncbi:unnamed protein product [Paramecium primaurelia]|uniref:Uncharacterized protein n=1 Tax=Paramecium primaurelia TaxID=5886 RepID=A0A8S1M2R0_PARPR|nr:unnamed protein product [Paramecium primaurelia]